MCEMLCAMKSFNRRVFAGAALIMGLLLLAAPVQDKNHLWKFSEFFSNGDGTIQFIEMQECCASDAETQLSAAAIASDANTYTFTADLPGPTGNKRILIATAGFAALAGAPTPDYIIPDGFFDPAGDTLRYRGTFDIVLLAPGAMPTDDGVTSLERVWPSIVLTPIVNTPTNFAGVSGSVMLAPVPTAAPLLVLGATLLSGSAALFRGQLRGQLRGRRV
jgi:hypothetical protein